ncbi:MAG: T9SS type A sorting domain-containing protein [Flavobacteriaceae bacterium]|nr:T9SS type A sorting domain-containing protein [Flavobacteriaceae bacterium]
MGKLLLIFILSLSSIIAVNSQNPNSAKKQATNFKNLRAFPNPFVAETTIYFHSSTNKPALLVVKTLLGNTVYSKKVSAYKGENNFIFHKGNLKYGMYIYTIQTTSESISKRLVIR